MNCFFPSETVFVSFNGNTERFNIISWLLPCLVWRTLESSNFETFIAEKLLFSFEFSIFKYSLCIPFRKVPANLSQKLEWVGRFELSTMTSVHIMYYCIILLKFYFYFFLERQPIKLKKQYRYFLM